MFKVFNYSFLSITKVYWYISSDEMISDRSIAEDVLGISMNKYHRMLKKISRNIYIDDSEYFFKDFDDAAEAAKIINEFYEQIIVMKKLSEK